ncbi:MAG TPA: hypothetical protein VIS76_07475, partial [Pseudomonadales bacterium]
IVAGAITIGYWGYRLYTGEKKAGLVFMAVAVLVLVGALATATSHLKSVGEGLQLSSATPAEPTLPAEAAEPAAADESAQPAAADLADAPSPFADELSPTATSAPAPIGSAPPQEAVPASDQQPLAAGEGSGAAAEPDAPARLATGQELGGRIVSVKSENVSLEWSSDSE